MNRHAAMVPVLHGHLRTSLGAVGCCTAGRGGRRGKVTSGMNDQAGGMQSGVRL